MKQIKPLPSPPDTYNDDTEGNFDAWSEYYEQWGQSNNIHTAIWSIYGKDLKELAFDGEYTVMYQGEEYQTTNPTWGELFLIGDKLMRLSGDTHHIFIEAFKEKGGGILDMSTGS